MVTVYCWQRAYSVDILKTSFGDGNRQMAVQRINVRFVGHVQGVGFRYTTVGIAQRYAVSGSVRNLPDGGVRIIAEGEAAELDLFLGEVQQTFSGQIREALMDRQPASGEFTGFAICY